MWRAFFLGIGVYLMIAGAECLAVDRVFWRMAPEPPPTLMSLTKPASPKSKDFPPLPGFPGVSCPRGRWFASIPSPSRSGWAAASEFCSGSSRRSTAPCFTGREAACHPRRKYYVTITRRESPWKERVFPANNPLLRGQRRRFQPRGAGPGLDCLLTAEADY